MPEVSTASPFNPLRHHSCALCRQRKVKCDKQGQKPCSYCVKHGTHCAPAAPSPFRPRKKRFPEAELLSRLRKYEVALKDYGADLDAILNGDGTPARLIDRSVSGSTEPGSRPNTELSAGPIYADEISSSRRMTSLVEEDDDVPRERLLEGDDEGIQGSPMLSAYDEAFYADDSTNILTLLTHPPDSVDLPSLHPRAVQIFNLWQVFLDNVHPVLRVFHGPGLQNKVLKTASDPASASPALHALLFAIYANALASMKDEVCLTVMNESRSALISRYVSAARHALLQSGFVGSTDLMVLQAFILYLYAIMGKIHPRSLVCLTGLADRIARTSGLHRSVQAHETCPFDTEIRRRVWWQVVILDTRAAELSASGTSILASAWNTPLPVNANESDLTANTDKLPGSRKGATDMIFCLVRCEIAEFLRQLRAQRGATVKWNEFSSVSIPLENKLDTIQEFENHLSSAYLSYCDPNIPLHVLTRYYATHATSKMKIVAYRTPSSTDRPLDEAAIASRQEGLMTVCIQVIEAYNRCAEDKLLKNYVWFSPSCFPFLAYGHLFFNLRNMTKGELASRAWAALSAPRDHEQDDGGVGWLSPVKPIPYDVGNAGIQSAFARLAVAAWDAREAALQEEEVQPSIPDVIVQMKKLLKECGEQQVLPLRSTRPPSEADPRPPAEHQKQGGHYLGGHNNPLNTPYQLSQAGQREAPSLLLGMNLGEDTSLPWDMSIVGGPVQSEEDSWQSWMSYEAAWNQIDWEKSLSF